MNQKQPLGSVMVVGAGIAGIQASLDLANSGYLVYLVEQKSAIGGVMAQLDKTFPTNDCSMCIISPKLVECGRHLNIDLLTLSEIQEVLGEAGHFKVRLLEKPRYVDMSKCTACNECAKACPIDIPNTFNYSKVEIFIMPFIEEKHRKSEGFNPKEFFGISSIKNVDQAIQEMRNEWDRI